MAKVAKVIVWIGAEVANSNRGVEVAPRVTFRTMEEASAWQDATPVGRSRAIGQAETETLVGTDDDPEIAAAMAQQRELEKQNAERERNTRAYRAMKEWARKARKRVKEARKAGRR